MSTNSESLSQQLTFYGLTAHSGKQLFACWSTMGVAANDDYLILPELKDGNRSISFWARSIPFMYGGEGYDKFEIVYSTGNNDIDNFVILEGSETNCRTMPNMSQSTVYLRAKSVCSSTI